MPIIARDLRSLLLGSRRVGEGSTRRALRRCYLFQQRLRLLQVTRVETFSEPAVDRSQQFSSLLRFPLITPEPRHAHGGAEFPGFSLLLTCNHERTLEMSFSLRGVRVGWLERD